MGTVLRFIGLVLLVGVAILGIMLAVGIGNQFAHGLTEWNIR